MTVRTESREVGVGGKGGGDGLKAEGTFGEIEISFILIEVVLTWVCIYIYQKNH